MSSNVKVSKTGLFGTLDPASSKVQHITAAAPAASKSSSSAGNDKQEAQSKDHKTRLTKSTGKLVDESGKGKIGGPFTLTKDPAFLKDRLKVAR